MEDIIYLEVDSEITEAIDKLKDAKGAEVKLVVPARSSLAQSAVNLKLLKKAAESDNKKLSLVTGDKTAKFLAARIGIPVAANVKAEAAIPELPEEADVPDIDEAELNEAIANDQAKKGKKSKAAKEPKKDDSPIQTRSLAEDDAADEVAEPVHHKKSKSSKIPDYQKFQKRLFGGIAAAVGVIALILLLNLLPSAKVVILASADKKSANVDFTLDAGKTESNAATGVIAARKLTVEKDLSSDFTATGKKDVGTKATGTVSVSNTASSSPITLAAGTIFTSSGKTFTLNQATTVPGAGVSNGSIVPGKVNAAITASSAGDSYNLTNTTFSITGQSSSVSASGSTTGGTSKQVTVVSQDDIDKAKASMLDAEKQKAQDDLASKAGKSVTVFNDTFTPTVSDVSSSVQPDAEASTATVKAHVVYSVLSAANSDLDDLFDTTIRKDLKSNFDIYKNGREDATYKVDKVTSADVAQISATSTAYVGSKIDKAAIAKKAAGKSKKSVSEQVKNDVSSAQSVTVDGLPFWPWMPLLSSHITVEIKVNTN